MESGKVLETLASIDEQWSHFITSNVPPEFKKYCKLFEYAFHGIPWLAGSFILLGVGTFFHMYSPFATARLLLIGLLFDLLCVAAIKLTFRRQRPSYGFNDDQWMPSPTIDDYSMPSGHTSRAAMVFTIICSIFQSSYRTHIILQLISVPLSMVVGLSRVVSGRHFLFDALIGIILGYCEGALIASLF